jgi:hypothetical protein
MKTITFIAIVLLASPLAAQEDDADLRDFEERQQALEDVRGLIQAGRLNEAERAIDGYELRFAKTSNADTFRYSPRIEIGDAYLERGEPTEAIRLFRSASPAGWCGNCLASQRVEKSVRIAMVHQSQLNFPAAFASYLGALPSTALGGGLFRIIAGLLYSGTVTIAPFVVAGYFLARSMRGRKPIDKVAERRHSLSFPEEV